MLTEKRKIRNILVKEIKSQIKGEKQKRLLKSINMKKIKSNYKTKPGNASMEIKSVGETAFQRAIFLSRKTKINFNPKKDILWKDLELPVIFTKNSRRNCVDLIGNIGNQLVICELKFMKETSSDSPWYAVLELLIYYYIINFLKIYIYNIIIIIINIINTIKYNFCIIKNCKVVFS